MAAVLGGRDLRERIATHLSPNDRTAITLAGRNMHIKPSQWDLFAKRLRVLLAAQAAHPEWTHTIHGSRIPEQDGVHVIGKRSGAPHQEHHLDNPARHIAYYGMAGTYDPRWAYPRDVRVGADRRLMSNLVTYMKAHPNYTWYIVAFRYRKGDRDWTMSGSWDAWDGDWYGPPYYDLILRDFQAPLPR